MKRILSLITVAVLAVQPLYASEAVDSQVNQSNGQSSGVLGVEQKKTLAKEWGLNFTEWRRYEAILQGPKGLWYKKLDPTHVLGLDAKTEAERYKYARLQAEIEFKRVSAELEFQEAFRKAHAELYPELPLIDESKFDQSPLQKMLSGGQGQVRGRAIYFVDMACVDCKQTIQKLVSKVGTEWLAGIDFYFPKSQSKKDVFQWAKKNNISAASVNSRLITLNLDNGTYQKLKRLGGDKLYLQAKGKVEILPEHYL